jgi:hypothetical protein
MSLPNLVAAIIVAAAILFFFGRWIGRVRFTVANAFWCSAISHIFTFLIMVTLGYLLYSHLTVAFLLGIVIIFVFQVALFQLFARSQNEVLRRGRAALLSLIVIFGDLLLASPTMELICNVIRKT